MKKLFLYLYFTVLGVFAYNQTMPVRAPLEPSFVTFMESLVLKERKKSSEQYGLGYIPNYFTIHFNNTSQKETAKKVAGSFPFKFDLREVEDSVYVTAVKDQGPLGACWSFSTLGAIESNWLKRGFGYYDLSEQNMATCHGFEWGIDDGGNDFIALAYLTRLSGPVTEESDPYNAFNTEPTCKKDGLVIPAYVPTAELLPKDISILKDVLMKHGAISASMYTGGTNLHHYYNPQDYTFRYEGTTPVDHAVLLVGWNDSIVVTGGSKSPSENPKGAWIVKNSWGESFGDSGYFYISYNDSRFLHSAAVFRQRLMVENIDTLYYNDFLGATTSFGFGSEIANGLVKYHASQNHFIRKIGTYINTEGSIIDIEIYRNFQGDTLLNDLIASSYGNRVKYPGYQTFDISAVVYGDYYVKIKYNTPGYNFPVPAESPIVVEDLNFALPEIKPSGNHWISNKNMKWNSIGSDVSGFEADLCIRVYADTQLGLNPQFTVNKSFSCVGSPIVFSSESEGDINDYLWDFGTGSTPSTTNSKGPHNVTYDSPGWKDVSMRIVDTNGDTAFLTRNFYIEDNAVLDVYFLEQEVKIPRGQSAQLTAYGADSYSWLPLRDLDIYSGPEVIASPRITTTFTVSGTMGTCKGEADIRVRVVSLPPNDNVCAAIELKPIGRQGSFTNANATVQPGEPAPPEGDCNTPLQWCVEGGLHNSVWFYFYGTTNGIASFNTEGMDNQIAIYKADHCDSIFSPTGHVLIAANDDYHDEENLFAAAIDSISLIPGQLYFLQVDGSAGGEEGVFHITFWDAPIGIEKNMLQDGLINIYPNPTTGVITVSLSSGFYNEIGINVINLFGKIVHSRSFEFTGMQFSEEIDLSHLISGLYIVEVSEGNDKYRKLVILK